MSSLTSLPIKRKTPTIESSVPTVFEVPELADAVLQFLPTNAILALRLVCSAFHDICTHRRWFFKDMIKFADTEYLTLTDQITNAMAPWVRSVGFFRYKKEQDSFSARTVRRQLAEEPVSWLRHVIAWNQLTIMEISVPWNDWTTQMESAVLEILETKAMMAQVNNSSAFPQVVRTEADERRKGAKIRVWECHNTLGLRKFVLHSSHSSNYTSIGPLLAKMSRGVHPSSSPSSSSTPLFESLVSFRLGGKRETNRVKVPWSSLVQFLKTGAPALQELSLDAHYVTLETPPKRTGPAPQTAGVDTKTDEEEMAQDQRDKDESEDKAVDMPGTPVFLGIRSFTLLSTISKELVGKLRQAFPNLKSLTVSSLDPFWEESALDPSGPSIYGTLPLKNDESMAGEMDHRKGIIAHFPRLERLVVQQLSEERRPENHSGNHLEPPSRKVLSPLLRELVLENTVAQGTKTVQSLETPATMRLERLDLIFESCGEVPLEDTYKLDVCADFLYRPCCQELRHLSLARGNKILGLMMETVPSTYGIIHPDNDQWMVIQKTIRARVPFVNHLRTLDLRGYRLLFAESRDLIRKLNHLLRCCPHLSDLGLLDILHEDVPRLFHGLGYGPEDYEDKDEQNSALLHNPLERPRLHRLALEALYCCGQISEQANAEKIKGNLQARFRFLQDLQVKVVQSLSTMIYQ